MRNIILDVSNSEQGSDEDIRRLTCAILEKVPDARLYFLGNRDFYKTDHIALPLSWSAWRAENAGRCRLLLPVLEFNGVQPEDRTVFIGDGPVFDLEDLMCWRVQPPIWFVYMSTPVCLSRCCLPGPAQFPYRQYDGKMINIDHICEFLLEAPRGASSSAGSGNTPSITPVELGEGCAVVEDRTRYPVLRLDSIGYKVSLLPVTKMQFEKFLTDSSIFSADVYEEVFWTCPGRSAPNPYPLETPRISPTWFVENNRERLFATGLLPKEIDGYAHWLGEADPADDAYLATLKTEVTKRGNSSALMYPAGQLRDTWALPTVDIWRRIHKELSKIAVGNLRDALCAQSSVSDTAKAVINALFRQVKPKSLLDLSLMSNGLFEWILDSEVVTHGLGNPRRSFSQGLFHPMLCPPVFVFKADSRRQYDFGFRLVQKLG